MKLRETKELKTKSAEELNELEKTISTELLKVRLKHGVGQLEQTTSIRELRRDLARVKNRVQELARATK
jgi:large subunit ribosomal protein L29